MAYPLAHGETLRLITIATVLSGAFTMVLHSYFAFGLRFALSIAFLTSGYALGIEIIGTKTGWPFGTYHYSSTLGLAVASVPLLVPFAWLMMTIPF